MIDHLQCGAYKTFYPNIKDEQEEIDLHKKHMQMAKDKMHKLFPNYPFRGFLMDLDGKCVEIELK